MSTSRRFYIRTVSFALVIAVLGVAFGVYEMYEAMRLERALEANYTKSLSELSDHVSEIEYALEKGSYATTPSQVVSLFYKVSNEAAAAKCGLGELPLTQEATEKISKFLSQSGDYVYSLAKHVAGGDQLDDSQREGLDGLYEYTKQLSAALSDLQSQYLSKSVGFGSETSIRRLSTSLGFSDKIPDIGNELVEMQASVTDYPSLIYDGPFSDHIEKLAPVFLAEKEEISQQNARVMAAEYLGVDAAKLENSPEGNGVIPCWSFMYGDIYVAVSKQGGYLYQISDPRAVESDGLSPEEAVDIALKFLKQRGFPDMEMTYYYAAFGILTANFAYIGGDTVYYPDLIKVGIAMDNGAIISFDSTGFLMCHSDSRPVGKPAVSEAEAAKVVGPLLTRKGNARLAVIPSEGKFETLCWEFLCENSEGQSVLTYVNALTGAEQQILILLESEAGTLTM